MPPVKGSLDAVGFFGPPTSTIDWCESNYEISYYFAEFWNTVSNLFILFPPTLGIINTVKQRMERRFIVSYTMLIIIGLGSWMFHMSLLYEMQLMDEVPMVYGTAVMGYCLVQTRDTQSRSHWKVALFFTMYCVSFTIAYLIFKDPYIHEAMFLILVFSLLFYGLKMFKQSYSRKCVKFLVGGTICYAMGALTWNLDNHICGQLTWLRQEVLPFGLKHITQLHSWWHFFVGYGTYMFCVAFQGYRQKFLHKEFNFKWIMLIPVIVLSKENVYIEDEGSEEIAMSSVLERDKLLSSSFSSINWFESSSPESCVKSAAVTSKR